MPELNPRPDTIDVHEVAEEFRERSLRYVEGGLAKLVFLSSCRDYNSGRYRHDGLARRFSEQAVHEALALCHRELFEGMIRTPLTDWVVELRHYFAASGMESFQVWKELRPYQIVIPLGTTALATELFNSNLKIALEILSSEQGAG
jgi:hypothetical protein